MATSASRPQISAVVVHTGGLPHIRNFLASLFASTRVPIEAVVVDNCSGTVGLAAAVGEFPGARLHPLAERKGYAAASNDGIRVALGRHVLWCNDDLVFHAGAVDTLAAFLDAHPDYGAAGPRLLNPDGSFQPCFALVHLSFLNLIAERLNLSRAVPSRWMPFRSHEGHESEERDVAVVAGACMLIRRAALESIGGSIDDRYFLYAEEFDLCYRIQRQGWRIRYVPTSVVTHLGSQTTVASVSIRPTHFRWVIQSWRSRFAYLHKNSGALAEGAYAMIFALTAVPRALVMRIRAAAAEAAGDSERGAGLRARARLHLFAARMALTPGRRDASRYPEYPF
ncbi:MAG TPA: glycosyltransferase family 2 protein [Gemmatimonadaceae bacterium]|nr:glycosyltransferase family 2 protein [Gemmatimonadaceae bacterium]